MKKLKFSFFAAIVIAFSFTSCVSSYDAAHHNPHCSNTHHSHGVYARNTTSKTASKKESKPFLISLIHVLTESH